MMKRGILVIIAMISILALSSFRKKNGEENEVKTTYASHYGDKFNGRKTASGQIFSNAKMTAAHRKLPFGTKVKVTNPKTGESVVVTINDRGPFIKSRGLDLSKAAFDAIGNLKSGVMQVQYQVLDDDSDEDY